MQNRNINSPVQRCLSSNTPTSLGVKLAVPPANIQPSQQIISPKKTSLSVLLDELVLPDVDGLVPVGLAVPDPDVSLHQNGLPEQHNLGLEI